MALLGCSLSLLSISPADDNLMCSAPCELAASRPHICSRVCFLSSCFFLFFFEASHVLSSFFSPSLPPSPRHRSNLPSPLRHLRPSTSWPPWATVRLPRRVSRSWYARGPWRSTRPTWPWPPSLSAWGPASLEPVSIWRASCGRRLKTVSEGL